RDLAVAVARERTARESEQRARAAAEVGQIALLAAVDHPVAAVRAAARVEVALVARQRAVGREAETRAGLPGEVRTVPLLALPELAVPAERLQGRARAGVVLHRRAEHRLEVAPVDAARAHAHERTVLGRRPHGRAEAVHVPDERSVGQAIET